MLWRIRAGLGARQASLTTMDIACRHVHKSFAEQKVLHDFNCEIPQGSSFALMGASGSGKSTLLNFLAGLDIPDQGEIEIGNVIINQQSEKWREQWRQRTLGILRQDALLDPRLTALENVLVPSVFRKQPNHSAEDYRTHAEILLKNMGLEQQTHQKSATLSGGQQMRVALARALNTQPQILIADEPTGTLDEKNAFKLGTLLTSLSQELNFTLIIATHDPHLAQSCSNFISLNTSNTADTNA